MRIRRVLKEVLISLLICSIPYMCVAPCYVPSSIADTYEESAYQHTYKKHLLMTLPEVHEITVEPVPTAAFISTFTEAEIDLATRIVIAESGAECYEGQCAVAQVIYDRTVSNDTTVDKVVLKKGQFTKPFKGDITKFPEAIRAVQAVFTEGYRVFEESAFIFFNPVTASKSAMRVLRKYNYLSTIGNHEFRGGTLIGS